MTEGQTVLTSSVYGLGEKATLAKPEAAEKPEKDTDTDKDKDENKK